MKEALASILRLSKAPIGDGRVDVLLHAIKYGKLAVDDLGNIPAAPSSARHLAPGKLQHIRYLLGGSIWAGS